ncbi:hypothetical protein T4B_9839 [Trichinella pseudospiralis]|uniref:Uncharacterized protein n=1 Tax=Trichinella pseudospiralis TaxID=6337 RepID=A0A0V1E667_TRIPS|nr:hypothetical protein T4A_4853 [Trichinella pseudospiralis]KRZ28129.1 hypothetical protein T4B_9839 [Trichinella pseudospiralis]KRZ31173.1 hypothetical protein T4C_3737 [Trichinella pseudospiralis]
MDLLKIILLLHYVLVIAVYYSSLHIALMNQHQLKGSSLLHYCSCANDLQQKKCDPSTFQTVAVKSQQRMYMFCNKNR